jgi:transcription termination factor Rho
MSMQDPSDSVQPDLIKSEKSDMFESKITLKPKRVTPKKIEPELNENENNSNNAKVEKLALKPKPVERKMQEKKENTEITTDIESISFELTSETDETKATQKESSSEREERESQDRYESFRDRRNRERSENRQVEDSLDLPYPPNPENTIIVQDVRRKSVDDLVEMAESYGISNSHRMLKQDLVSAILKNAANLDTLIYTSGVIEIIHEGHGFIRSQENNYVQSGEDVFISNNQIKKLGLRFGDQVAGYARAPKQKGERYFSLMRLTELNGKPSDLMIKKINFDNLTPLYPDTKLNFESADPKKSISTRVIDLISPIGKGQRALIVSPPKSGKTMLLQNIAYAINQNHPEVELIYLGIDERPEEFTEMQRTVKGEVVSSTFDEPAHRHVALAEIIIEKAKRMVEQGKDVIILLDSITRLARAYNNAMPSSGKILSGGVDSNALHRPKRFFGAARNIEFGGSLTIIATALVDTGSKMDEVIFEEFKGTGNSEIVLDRKFAEKRIFPAIDVLKSGTRKEEEMVSQEVLTKMWMLRRIVSGMGSGNEALEFLIKKIKDSKDNDDFFRKMNQSPNNSL